MIPNRILVITEANEKVASGHLLECIELSKLLKIAGLVVDFAINDDACDAFKQRIDGNYLEYHQNVEDDFAFFSALLNDENYSVIITNLREVSNNWIKKIKSVSDAVLICIDEWGNRRLDCDIIINPMINPCFWEYFGSKAKLFAGQNYLILPEILSYYHVKHKTISDKITRVCISMGGVDKFGTTIKVLTWILRNHSELKIDVILGGGFQYDDELYSVSSGYSNISIMKNINNIYDYFEKVDLAFCAGGNTLHELACIGTPVIVIPTMDHELNNGKRFEDMGFGITLPKSESLTNKDIEFAWEFVSDLDIRRAMASSGKKICDGNGGKRVIDIVKKCVYSI